MTSSPPASAAELMYFAETAARYELTKEEVEQLVEFRRVVRAEAPHLLLEPVPGEEEEDEEEEAGEDSGGSGAGEKMSKKSKKKKSKKRRHSKHNKHHAAGVSGAQHQNGDGETTASALADASSSLYPSIDSPQQIVYSPSLLARFLIGRKWVVKKALSRLLNFHELAQRIHLSEAGKNMEDFRRQLQTGKSHMVPSKREGTALFCSTPRLHVPGAFPIEQSLQILCLSMLHLLDNARSVRMGISLVIDISGLTRAQIALGDWTAVLDALSSRLPTRINTSYAVNVPWPLHLLFLVIVRPLIAPKLLKRLICVTTEELLQAIPSDCIPKSMGGTLEQTADDMVADLQKSWDDLYGTRSRRCMVAEGQGEEEEDEGGDREKEAVGRRGNVDVSMEKVSLV